MHSVDQNYAPADPTFSYGSNAVQLTGSTMHRPMSCRRVRPSNFREKDIYKPKVRNDRRKLQG